MYRLKERKGVALVFAPERALESLWGEAAQLKLVKVDIAAARGVDLLTNLESLPIRSSSLDLIWCHHVLEHIEHRQAITELSRVLSTRGGELIVSVPMQLGTSTREYGFADPRESVHWRIYGDDFAQRLEASDLTVATQSHRLSPDACRQFGITPERF